MRPVSSRPVLWMSVSSVLLALFAFASFTFAQTTADSKHKLLPQTMNRQPVAGDLTLARPALARPALPGKAQANGPQTGTDTWTGGGGANTNWSDNSNWNNGAPGGQNVVITMANAATNEDDNASIGTLQLGSTDSVTLQNNTTLTVGGNISNAGTISLASTGYGTVLSIGASLTLSGSGTVVLGGGGPNYIGGASGTTLTNTSTIEGGGGGSNDQVGLGQIAINNSTGGVINANVSGTNLYVDPGAASTNTGTLEATNGGALVLNGSSWNNAGGTISAATGSAVDLTNGVSITGGTLTSSGTGFIYDQGGQTVYLTNVTNNGTYDVQNNAQTQISGTFTNNGTVNLQSTGYGTGLYLAANTTLTGTGTVVLGTGGPNYISGASGTTLTIDEMIEGGGGGANDNVGDGVLTLVNNSTINANVSGTNLYVDPGAASTNTGTLEATNGGTLVLYGSTWNNAGGTISAAAGSAVDLTNGVSITGGTLSSTGTGFIYDQGGQTVYLSNLTIASGSNYDVQNNATTVISGTITNNGTINLQSTGYGTDLYVPASGSATLTGSGSVVLGYGGPNYIGGGSGASLTIDQTISGIGNVGEGQLTMVNNSTIDANISPTVSTAVLYVDPSAGGLTNSSTGVLEATNGGTLVLYGGNITNNGTIEAVGADGSGNASTVDLTAGVSITGGTLTSSGAGFIYEAGGQTVYLTNVTNNGTYDIENNATTQVSGTITNNGTINLQSTGYGTALYLAANTTLKGTGTVVLGSGGPNYVDGASGTTLINEETIEGQGYIGTGITVVNNSVINANVNGGALYLEPTAASTNTKTLEATNGGTLVFNGGTWTQTGAGTITAAAGSAVDLTAGTSITGGVLTSSGTGYIYEAGGQTVYLTNLTNDGTYDITNNATTEISGTITNNGTINLQSTGYGTQLYLAASTTLKGKGSVVLGNGGPNYVDGASGTTLTNDETIEGAGYIGSGIKVVNSDVIDANVSGAALVLEPTVASTNSKTLEATNGGTLEFDGGTWKQTGAGTITAATGSAVELTAGTNISGGVMTSSGTGFIYEAGGQTVYLSNITNGGTYDIENNATTEISGTITNNGTINLQSTGYGTQLYLSGNTTLNGTGAVVLGSGGPNYVDGASGAVLTNNSTIEGVGNLGNGELTITNNGTIEALNGTLQILPGSGGLTNYNSSTNTLTGGTFIANGGNLTFAGSATGITTLSAAVVEENGGQLIDTNGNINALASLTSITSSGSLVTDVNFTDAGAFSNAGSLTILAGTTFNVGSLTQISGNTLTAGTYVLDANLGITGTAQNITTNAANLTLAGGTIENTSNSTNALANLAVNSGTLTLANNANFTTVGNFNNTGTLAVDKGSTFTVTGTLAQISGSTLASGSFVLGGTLEVGNGISITTNAANLTLEGGTIKSGSANALANLASNTGTLAVANNSSFTAGGNFNNSGALDVTSGSTFTVSSGNTYTQSAGTTTVDGTLSGTVDVTGGTLLGAGGLKGNVTVSGGSLSVGDAGVAGLLKITGTYTQLSTGALNVAIGGTAKGTYSELTVTGAASLGGTLTVNLINGFVPKVGAKFTILSAKSITGTFSTQYIVINGSEYFAVSYTAKGVVLTVESGVPPTGNGSTAQGTIEARNNQGKSHFPTGTLSRRNYFGAEIPHAEGTLERGYGYLGTVAQPYRIEGTLRSPYHLPELPTWRGTLARPVALPKTPGFGLGDDNLRNNVAIGVANNWTPNPRGTVSPRLPLFNESMRNQARGTAVKSLLPLLRSR